MTTAPHHNVGVKLRAATGGPRDFSAIQDTARTPSPSEAAARDLPARKEGAGSSRLAPSTHSKTAGAFPSPKRLREPPHAAREKGVGVACFAAPFDQITIKSGEAK